MTAPPGFAPRTRTRPTGRQTLREVSSSLSLCRRFARFAVCVVGGNAILGAEDARRGFGINPRGVSVGGAFVADDLPGGGGAVFALDGVLDRAGGATPGDEAQALGGDDGGRRDGVRR